MARQYSGNDTSSTFQDTTATFDGYGRLKTQHRPEQDANTATTYNYYNDDRIQQVVDARGATINYSYDNRGLTTQVSTTSPNTATIPITPTVTMSYDNLGNRTSMTDGLGTQTYEYNQLSQLTAETRSFTDSLPNAPLANNSFKIQYSYTLGGQLKSITDPYNSQINYSHDKIGRLNSVTGSSFAGVTNYAANPQYRAWGGLKHFEYSNGINLDATFNNRLQVDSFKILHPTDSTKKVFDKQYQYYGDGNLKFIGELTDPTYKRWDRFYTYDHAERVQFARTGIEASGGTVNNVTTYDYMPYRQTYAYDVFNNLTNRISTKWKNEEDWNFYNAYQNNRAGTITYDADGHEIFSIRGQSNFQYNASGQLNKTWRFQQYETELGLDGEGHEAQRSQRVWNTTNNAWESWKSVYNIRSSLLGQTISEANFDGKKMRSLVIGGGSIIAHQKVEDTGTEKVVFEFSDASGNSMRQVDLNGLGIGSSGSAELDPKGNNVGLTWLTGSSLRRERPDTGLDSKVADTQSMCTLGGLYGPCSIVENLLAESHVRFGSLDTSNLGTFARRANMYNLPFQMTGRTPYNPNNPLVINNDIDRENSSPSLYFHNNRGGAEVITHLSNRSYDPQFLNYLVGNPSGGQQTTLRTFNQQEWDKLLDASGIAGQALNNEKCRKAILDGIVTKPVGLSGNGDPRDVIRDIFDRGKQTQATFGSNTRFNSGSIGSSPALIEQFSANRGLERDDGFTKFAAAGVSENGKGYIRIGDPFFSKNIVGNLLWGQNGAPKLNDEQTRALILLHEIKHIITGDYSTNHDVPFNTKIYNDCLKNLKIK